MPNWKGIRRRAAEKHRELRALCPTTNHPLIPADTLLRAAQQQSGYIIQPLREGDPLLSGAQAMLDHESERIWFAQGASTSPQRDRFAQAHEFGHLWLHPNATTDEYLPGDGFDTFLPDQANESAQIEEGYSPQERREQEANIFAAELLLPIAALREAFIVHKMRASELAAYTGLSEACVLAQLSFAVLACDPAEGSYGQTGSVPADIGLDASQRAAAYVAAGPILVDAGPGTGKTRTLIARIAHLIQDQHVPPERIAALTFSNRAAAEIADRLRESVGELADRVWLGTFHAFGFEMLRKEGRAIGLPERPLLIESVDAIALLERIYDRLNLCEYEYLNAPTLPFPDILACISRAKDEMKTPEDYYTAALALMPSNGAEEERSAAAKALEVAHVYTLYQQMLAEEGLVDYGDLLFRSVQLLQQFPAVRRRMQERFPCILADEYQDVNRATAQMLKLLAGEGHGFWAVGDLRQAIYRFRGASPQNIRQFETDFPTGKRISLEFNYRSRPPIVKLFGAFAENLAEGSLWHATRPDENTVPTITVVVAADESRQADWIADQIGACKADGFARSEQAILTATHRQAIELSDHLTGLGIPTNYVGPLFNHPEVKDLLSLLSLVCDADGSALARVARFSEYAIPESDVRQLLGVSSTHGIPFLRALSDSALTRSLSPAGAAGLHRLRNEIIPIAHSDDAWKFLARYLFDAGHYLDAILTDDDVANGRRRRAIYNLLIMAHSITSRLPKTIGEDRRVQFLARLRRLVQFGEARSTRGPEVAPDADAVKIMTVHQAKGLEFPVVYLPNLARGMFPSSGRGKMAAIPHLLTDAEEETSQAEDLFFVALSRARDRLYLSRPTQRNGKPVPPSPLLERIGDALNRVGASQLTVPASAPTIRSTETPAPAGGRAAEESTAPLMIRESALNEYMSCPRRFYYNRELHLPVSRQEQLYLAFHNALHAALESIPTLDQTETKEEQQEAGRQEDERATRGAIESIQACFDAAWLANGGSDQSAHGRVLHQRALQFLEQTVRTVSTVTQASAPSEMQARFRNGTVRVAPNRVEPAGDGTRIIEFVHRPLNSRDHTKISLALLRKAAQDSLAASEVEIVLQSTANGERREVKPDRRWEPGRLEKYEQALAQMAQRRFPAAPSDFECPTCPFFLICPT